ncbi:MAG: class I SAM-dependent methyltransferase [Chloroflexi bacterium]|nr:class I SAM-dependent methyltransferase [Chloroflexota bacterium]
MGPPFSLDEFYDAYPRVEEQFQADLDDGLDPRGPDFLFQLVGDMTLAPGACALDVGCGEGRDTVQLATQFDLRATGIDPVERHILLASEALAAEPDDLSERVSFKVGRAEALPVDDRTMDLVWCRDVLSHVVAIDSACAEFRRVLRDDGRVLIYQMFGTARLEPREAEWLWKTMGVAPGSADPDQVERGFAAAGLQIEKRIVIGTEFGEWAEETSGKASRQLLHAARLLRSPDRYIAKFGNAAHEIMLGDCLWHVYGMIGKLSRRVYLLSSA